MAIHSTLYATLPEDYGYVILTGVAANVVAMWMARNVSRARKEYSVEYPDMYSKDSKMFNCIQRAHQNTLEVYPGFMFLLLTGGLQYPRISAGCGALFLLGRIQFARGYYTGEPRNRRWGAFGMIGMLLMLGNTISFACHQLGWVGKQ